MDNIKETIYKVTKETCGTKNKTKQGKDLRAARKRRNRSDNCIEGKQKQ